MLQNLMTERFGLKFHEDNQDVQGFELIIGRSGFKLTPSTAPVKPLRTDIDPGGFTWFSSMGGCLTRPIGLPGKADRIATEGGEDNASRDGDR